MDSTMYSGYSGKERTSSAAEWNRPQTVAARQQDELMVKSAHDLDSVTDPMERLRLMCLSKGASGILGLGRIFRRIDYDGSQQIGREEFVKGIKEIGLNLTDQDADDLFTRFDPDNTGSINVDEFLRALRPPMSESRRSIVEQAFKKMDKSGEGVITIADLRRTYSVNCSPRYMSGEDTADYTMNKFLKLFEEDNRDGTITLEEFMNYYSGVGVAIEHDSYFDLMMRQAYKL